MSIRYDLTSINPEQLTEQIRKDTGYVKFAPRSEMELYSEYLHWVRQGKKTTTVRYRRGAIDCPIQVQLPLYATNDYTGKGREWAGWAVLRNMTIKKFGELNLEDAVEDGFSTLEDLAKALQNIYGIIEPNDFVTIYTFQLLPTEQQQL